MKIICLLHDAKWNMDYTPSCDNDYFQLLIMEIHTNHYTGTVNSSRIPIHGEMTPSWTNKPKDTLANKTNGKTTGIHCSLTQDIVYPNNKVTREHSVNSLDSLKTSQLEEYKSMKISSPDDEESFSDKDMKKIQKENGRTVTFSDKATVREVTPEIVRKCVLEEDDKVQTNINADQADIRPNNEQLLVKKVDKQTRQTANERTTEPCTSTRKQLTKSTSTFGPSLIAPNTQTATHLTRANSARAISDTRRKSKSSFFQSKQHTISPLVRSQSDRTLPTFGPATLDSLQIHRQATKKRSKIKKSLSKLHKALKSKLVPPLEESEKSGDDYLPGSEESDASEVTEQIPSNGLTNGDCLIESSSHSVSSPINHGAYSYKSSSLDPTAISRNSSPLHRSSSSSFELDSPSRTRSPALSDESHLKHNSTSPAALNCTTDADSQELIEDESVQSPNITPTHSNFNEHQLISPSMGIAYRPPHTLEIQNDFQIVKTSRSSSLVKQGSMRKKKRSGSWYNVISPSYKQKDVDFHKFFKDLPSTERLLVDYTCALMKDILVQGRLYVSQNYLCFHSNILKWQTAVTVKLVDIDTMTKEKTVKVFPNAIQVVQKDKTKMTFTSFTARDRAYLTTFRLWQNALLDKPMSARDLWIQIHSNYGEELGLCSSDDDYVKPEQMPRKHQSLDSATLESGEKYEFGTTNKVKKKKKSSRTQSSTPEGDGNDKKFPKSKSSTPSNRHSSQDSSVGFHVGTDNSTGDEKSIHSSQCTQDDVSEDEEGLLPDEDEGLLPDEDGNRSRSGRSSRQEQDVIVQEEVKEQEEDDEPAEILLPDCNKISLSCEYNITARDMFRIIFGDNCPFWKDTLVNKHSTEIEFGTWYDDDKVDGQKLRNLSYTLRLDNPIGPKTSHCKEVQILYPTTIIGKTYAVDCIVQNYGIPYADYFQTCMRYCIRKLTRSSCHVRVTSELRYKKTPWGLIKNFIEKNVASGLTENFKKLEVQLQERIDFEKQQATSRNKSNVRRRQRRSESTNGAKDSQRSSQRNVANGGVGEGLKADVNNNKRRNTASSDLTPGVPSPLLPNGYISNNYSTSSENTTANYLASGKLISGAIVFIFLLLIYSNYTMYQRLTTLEQVTAAAATADGVDPSVTAALLDRPGVPISSNPEILSAYLQAIDKRLRRLEDTMIKFTEGSAKKWEKMEHDWSSLQEMIQTVLKQRSKKG